MVFLTTKVMNSTIAAIVSLGFLGSLFCMSLATPNLYYDVAYAGILISSALTAFFWRKERRSGRKRSSLGAWILLMVFLLFILLCVILPALS